MTVAERAANPTPAPRSRREPPRPEDDVGALPGVTAARREAFARLGVECVEDLLRLAPRRHEDRRAATPCADARPGPPVLIVGRVATSTARRLRGGLSLLEAALEDESGRLTARWFLRGFLPKALPAGARYALFGTVRERRGTRELASPERERLDDDAEAATAAPGLVPVHPLARGLTAPLLRRIVRAALPAAGGVADVLPAGVRASAGLAPVADALASLHFPGAPEDAERARRRLAFEELFVHELRLAGRRRARAHSAAVAIPVPARVDARIRARLPFVPTPAQERAIAAVQADLARAQPMHRLLQGDVGCGKTLVAAYALLAAVARGFQGAVMAPTEVLVRQHEATLRRLLAGSRVRLALLDGGVRGRARAEVLAGLAAGDVDVVVGTHAVLSDGVRFRRLALAVVDEQHKFGVRQRHVLVEKGRGPGGEVPHCLVMTATPIPRTLALTVFGDLDLSVIDALPPGRAPVETWVLRPDEAPRALVRVKAALARGEQAFVVYPLVEAGERGAVRDAVAGRERWARALPDARVGLVHGRLASEEKASVLDAFRARSLDVLVATVVVEVGVDVPNATVLVVEHAERFGLTQLHQLRGRVGRGGTPALCVLVDRSEEGPSARLEVLARTNDGFEVAEADLLERGVGDVLGTRQHGSPGFRAARLPGDLAILAEARDAARALLGRDPELSDPEHHALRSRLVEMHAKAESPAAGG